MKKKVRIALAIDPKGSWSAQGWNDQHDKPAGAEAMDLCLDVVGEGEARYWIEAEVDVPTPEQSEPTIEGTATRDSEERDG